ncbi:hypothetical protein SAMN06265347_10962 [Halobellus salinus]|nr:hypothetical protein SAMN06265347_10962 [Halobellus salinus]
MTARAFTIGCCGSSDWPAWAVDFHVALAGIGLAVAVGGIEPFLRGSVSLTAFVAGVVALAVAVFAAVRAYRLVTE